jgi:3-isopropylmalate/(R)-2-methylmalate dehydratase small subunit
VNPVQGRAWVFGDDVDTDALAPGAYMKFDLPTLARHCLETVNPAFARDVRAGDIVVAGRNFGTGSSREQAAQALLHLGVATVVAQSFAGIFHRNALNLGLLVLVCRDAGTIEQGTLIRVDPVEGRLDELDGGRRSFGCEPVPGHLLDMVRAGGLLPYLAQRLARERAAADRPS